MTLSEENHLKAIFHLYAETKEAVSTNAIAEVMNNKASSVTDMLKKLADKQQDFAVLTPMDYRKKVYQELREQARTDLQQDKKLLLLQKEFDAKLDVESIRPV